MRTTIDLPDGLYREAKTRAVREGMTLKDLVVGLIEAGLHGTPVAGSAPLNARRAAPPVAIRKVPGAPPVQPLSKRQLDALLEEEDLQRSKPARPIQQNTP